MQHFLCHADLPIGSYTLGFRVGFSLGEVCVLRVLLLDSMSMDGTMIIELATLGFFFSLWVTPY